MKQVYVFLTIGFVNSNCVDPFFTVHGIKFQTGPSDFSSHLYIIEMPSSSKHSGLAYNFRPVQ